MAFNVKKRGKLTYYYHGDHPVLSALVTEELPDGDLKIYFAGLTGGYSAKREPRESGRLRWPTRREPAS